MSAPIRFPIRIKILIATLFLVTGVVGTITFAMARLFHEDKRAYINDLVATTALSVAEESQSILIGYKERLHIYARVIQDSTLSAKSKSSLLQSFFGDFPEIIAISVVADGEESLSAYNSGALDAAGVTQEDFVRYRNENPLPLEQILDGEVYVRNSSLSPVLSSMTVAVAPRTVEGTSTPVIRAEISLRSLERLAARSPGFRVFLIGPDGILLADKNPERVARRDRVELPAAMQNEDSMISAGQVLEFVSENDIPMIGGYSSVAIGGVLAGVEIPMSSAYLTARNILGLLVLVSLGLLLLSTAVGLVWARRLTRPLEELSEATREIAKGDFGFSVNVNSRDEIGRLAGSFNTMSTELKHREDALQDAQSALVQSEKMAAFGQLGAGIAHEVKNPLAGILGCAQLSLRKIDKETPLGKNLKLIEKETRRCKTIIENLLRFARQEKAAMEAIQINPAVEDAMAIVAHQLEMNKVHLERNFGDNLPLIHGNGNQLQQVLMNLMMNAQQAMDGNTGIIRVSTIQNDAGQVEVHVADNGPGMTDEVRERLFEPFFTTKPGGKGTGLGLSVSFGIIKDHNGEIRVESEPGAGATFVITLPVLAEHKPQTVAAAKLA